MEQPLFIMGMPAFPDPVDYSTRGRQQSTRTFDPQVAQYFELVGLFGPSINNKTKAHICTTCPDLSAVSHEYIDLEHGVLRTPGNSEDQEYIEIPDSFESLEALEFVGFSPDMAKEIWGQWNAFSEETRYLTSFRKFAMSFVKNPGDSFQDSYSLQDDWSRSLEQLGVSTKLRDAIMLPASDSVRVTASCQFWVEDSMKRNWWSLRSLRWIFNNNAEYLQSIKFKGTAIDDICSVLDLTKLT
ncbi:hypothetical protein TWF694_005486 [Orbilia ellipsospora]|uniref:Uncharacterized protein n=1 Tax=Orbilia ellipsospora TaxID=2528407 RepID=A0AAV9WUK2_9PEZI